MFAGENRAECDKIIALSLLVAFHEHGLVLPFVVLYYHLWSNMAFHDLKWPFMVLHGHFIVFYGLSWWFIDPNSFGLVLFYIQKMQTIWVTNHGIFSLLQCITRCPVQYER